MQDFGDEILEVSVAVFVSVCAAIFAALLGVVAGNVPRRFASKSWIEYRAAWSGISLGIPIGTVFAIIAFIYTFRKIRRYGEPE